jgi:hypothetical protein
MRAKIRTPPLQVSQHSGRVLDGQHSKLARCEGLGQGATIAQPRSTDGLER